MKLKRIVLTIAVMTFMVFTISSITELSYAYWATNITPPTNSANDGTVGIGTWVSVTPWDPNATYSIGDRVSNNGVIYEAKKNNPTKEPGVDSGWTSQWIVIG